MPYKQRKLIHLINYPAKGIKANRTQKRHQNTIKNNLPIKILNPKQKQEARKQKGKGKSRTNTKSMAAPSLSPEMPDKPKSRMQKS